MSRNWYRGPFFPIALAIIGTSGLTYAWVRQNHELIHAYEESTRLQRSQLVIDLDEIARDQWLIAFNQEVGKEKPSDDALITDAEGSVEAVLMWQTHMAGRVAESSDEYNEILKARGELREKAAKLREVKDYKGLIELLHKLAEPSRNQQMIASLDKKFAASVKAANDKVAEIEGSMSLWYVVGTTFLLFSSILASVSLEITLRRLEGQIPHIESKSSNKKK